MIAFRSLRARIVLFFVILLVSLQASLFVLISETGERLAKGNIAQELVTGERIFRRLLAQRSERLTGTARVLALDFGFRAAIATHDSDTILSVLRNHGGRIDASLVTLLDLGGRVLADTQHPEQRGLAFAFPDLIARARSDGTAAAIVPIAGEPHQLVVLPILAPAPIAWVAMGFAMNDRTAADLQAVTGLHVSFLSRTDRAPWTLHASTLPPSLRADLALSASAMAAERVTPVHLGGENYQTLSPLLGKTAEGVVIAVLQRSLASGLEPFNRLRTILVVLALVSVGLSILGSVLIAGTVTRPVGRLSHLARQIRDADDYTRRAEVETRDEIGDLAASFNHMLDGITAREAQILRLAHEDTLTGLPNRAMFLDRLKQSIATARRSGSPVSVLLMDIDRFSSINETLGHPAGDELLRAVATRLRAALRESDTVARLGGDEFAILLPTGSTARADSAARRILAALEEPFVLDGQPVDVGASIGIATFPEHDDSPDMLLRHADVAMYVAKRGNAGFTRFDPAFDQDRQNHLSLLSELRRAIDEDQLSLHYQPKLSLRDGTVHRVEALVRWVHPSKGFVSPAEFIPFAEQTGYIKAVTRWVLRTAVRQAAVWRADGIDVAIAVNVSTRDLLGSDLESFVADLLRVHDVPASALCLEITESGIMEDPGRALATLERLHGLGLRLSVDDFGTGYSSLAYLRKLPVQELKIDRSFVANIASDADNATIVRSTIELGHNMGLEVVAEGVEHTAELDLLRRLGCDEAQGYVISKPMPAERFAAWLAAHERTPATC